MIILSYQLTRIITLSLWEWVRDRARPKTSLYF